MKQIRLLRQLLITTLLLTVSTLTLAQQMTAAQAAEEAERQTGGKVLQVKDAKDNRYRVKVLLPNGQVRSLLIDDNDNK